jgi:hypothetical protein
MRHRLHLAVRVGLVVAGMIAPGRPVCAFPQDDKATQQIADMAASHIKATTRGRIAEDQLDKVVKDYIGELLKTVPALGDQFKDAAALNNLVAKAKDTMKKLNSGPTPIGPAVPPPPRPEQPQKPADQPQKPADETSGSYFKAHPEWLDEAKKLLTKADRALASVLVTESGSDQAFKLKADKRAEELKNWVQHQGRFATDPYFLDAFLQKKVGKKVPKLSDDDMKALDPVIREITQSTGGSASASSAGANGAGRVQSDAGSDVGTGAGAASSSVVATSVVSSSADLDDDRLVVVGSRPRLFHGFFTRVRYLAPAPLVRERYVIVDP